MKIKKEQFYLIIICAFFSCSQLQEKEKSSKVTIKIRTDTNQRKGFIEIDTLRNPSHFYYLADIDIKIVSKWLISDSILPADNFFTFRVMDSLNAKSYSDRRFYIKPFLKIVEKDDGSLAEAVGSYAWLYVENHTREFFELTPPLSKIQLERWAEYVGSEIFLSTDSTVNVSNEGRKFIKKIKYNCSDCSEKVINKINDFGIVVMEHIEEMNK
jgi:hypothetical protein